MNRFTLTFSTILFIATSGCQRKIVGSIPEAKPASDISTKVRTDTLARTDTTPQKPDFTLSIEPKSFVPSSVGKAKLIITNNTKKYASTGLAYYIEFYEHDRWIGIPMHKKMNDLKYIEHLVAADLMPLSTRELESNLKPIPYDYQPGRYRITKEILTADKKELLLSTQFRVFEADIDRLPSATTANLSKFESLQDSLAMKVSPSVFALPDVNKAKVYLTNKSSYHLTAGDYYLIEYLNGDVWEKIIFKNVVYNDMAYGLDRRSPLQLDVYLYPAMHEYKRGKYRISKSLELRNKGDKFIVSTEFLIQ